MFDEVVSSLLVENSVVEWSGSSRLKFAEKCKKKILATEQDRYSAKINFFFTFSSMSVKAKELRIKCCACKLHYGMQIIIVVCTHILGAKQNKYVYLIMAYS